MEVWEAAYLAGVIDGEGTITLTRMHESEHRRPCISIASTDLELLTYLQTIVNGTIISKKNYKPSIHKDSYTFVIKKKVDVFCVLECIYPFLKIQKKKQRAIWILKHYDKVTPRNGKYSASLLNDKLLFEEEFFNI